MRMRLAVPGGWAYKNHSLNRARSLTLSLVFVPGANVPPDAPAEVPSQEDAEKARGAAKPEPPQDPLDWLV